MGLGGWDPMGLDPIHEGGNQINVYDIIHLLYQYLIFEVLYAPNRKRGTSRLYIVTLLI